MLWDQVEHLVEMQITYWQAVGKHQWADPLERCLAKARRCQGLQEAIVDLRQRLAQAEET
jgi:hypothetical protein